MAINLQKGQRINLLKENGKILEQVCVGVNWGAIQKNGWFGTTTESVDLDASCIVFDEQRNVIDVVYFGALNSKDLSIKHSGDDLVGDTGGDDGLDNEVITVDFRKINPIATKIVFVLNSYKGQDFGVLPFASIRIYEGTPTQVKETFANYNITKDTSFTGHVSMVLGIFYKRNNEWKFNAIGEPTKDRRLPDIIKTVQQSYI